MSSSTDTLNHALMTDGDYEAGVAVETRWPKSARVAVLATSLIAVAALVMAVIAVTGQAAGGVASNQATVAASGAPASLQSVSVQSQANAMTANINSLLTATPFCSSKVEAYKICQDIVDTASKMIHAIEDPTISNEDLKKNIADGMYNSHDGRYSRAILTSAADSEVLQGAGLTSKLSDKMQENIASTRHCFYKHEDSLCIAFEPSNPKADECKLIHTSGTKKGLPQDPACEVFPVIHLLNLGQTVGRRRGINWAKGIGGAVYGAALSYDGSHWGTAAAGAISGFRMGVGW